MRSCGARWTDADVELLPAADVADLERQLRRERRTSQALEAEVQHWKGVAELVCGTAGAPWGSSAAKSDLVVDVFECRLNRRVARATRAAYLEQTPFSSSRGLVFANLGCRICRCKEGFIGIQVVPLPFT